MVIWTRWGILGLLIPVALIVTAMISAEAIAKQRMGREDRKPVNRAPVADGAEEPPPEEDPEEAKAAERKRANDQDKAIKRAKDIGYLIGGLVSAAVLWPLGRWMNRSPVDTPYDPNTGRENQGVPGGLHAMFFIPLEYWGFVWAVFGLFKVFG